MLATPNPDVAPAPAGASLLLVLPTLFHERAGVLEVEEQAANGLRLYREHFEEVTVAAGTRPSGSPLPPSLLGQPAEEVAARLGVTLCPLPRFGGYRQALLQRGPRGLRRSIAEVLEKLGGLIDAHRVLQFTPSRHLDDWGSRAAALAGERGRPYAIYTDRVQEQMVLDDAADQGLGRKLRARVYARLMTQRRHAAIRGAALGMFHGADCHAAYREMVPRAELIHDIHTAKNDAIDDDAFARKLQTASDPDRPLRIVYAGRIDPDKGPLDFVDAMAQAGPGVEATWFGDGSQMQDMRERIAARGVGDRLRLPGFTADREALLAGLREHHLMMFCHKVPESPRCLIEALVCGTALVGYDSAYSRDLVGAGPEPAGLHVPRHDHAALGRELARLAADRPAVVQLMHAARKAGRHFNDEDVFAHRCALLRQHLGQA